MTAHLFELANGMCLCHYRWGYLYSYYRTNSFLY